MNDFRVKIVDDNGNVDIYTNAAAINIDNDRIVVDYEDQQATHLLVCTDEIVIKRNR